VSECEWTLRGLQRRSAWKPARHLFCFAPQIFLFSLLRSSLDRPRTACSLVYSLWVMTTVPIRVVLLMIAKIKRDSTNHCPETIVLESPYLRALRGAKTRTCVYMRTLGPSSLSNALELGRTTTRRHGAIVGFSFCLLPISGGMYPIPGIRLSHLD
jgi:hypothetical protein